jgi:hypothetical protein
MLEEDLRDNRITRKRYIQLTLLVWAAMIGVDFFLHGGLLAAVYVQKSPFLLSPMESFRRIPLGYLALLVSAGFLVWIMNRAGAEGWRRGLIAGTCIGAVMGVSLTLGLYSISTASPQLLAAWFAGQVFEMGIAGAVIGQGLAIDTLRNLTRVVILGVILLFVATIVLQSVGLAPSIAIR